MMLAGGCFADVTTHLVTEHGLDEREAIAVGERVFRGGDGVHPGLGRERIYLEAFLRVTRHLAVAPEDGAVLAFGQVSVEAADALRPYAPVSTDGDSRVIQVHR
jgi:hypothetical protein